ncbi:adenylate/guanylate cyclase domain-containing protein [Candidatus Poribacteria bacterium]|nr:adenylate/guanylate cyclase domain-containing protein [Candidatus Poribacteria bacterium]
MPKLSEDKRNRLIEISAAVLISVAFYLLSLTSPFQRLELLSLDARFNLRPPLMTNPDIATIDIDDRALKDEGRWQDWTRDKHARIVDTIRQGSGALIGFDIYFSEESEKIIRPKDIAHASTLEEAKAAFRDYDAELAESIRKAGNVYLGATFVLAEQEKEQGSKKDRPDLQPIDFSGAAPMWKSLDGLIQKGQCIRLEGESAGSILQARAPQAVPIPRLIDAARGAGFAQIVREADGLVRMYPTFIRCDKPSGTGDDAIHLFPSMALAMTCDYLQVPLKNLKLKPGEYLEIPNAHMPDGQKRTLRIPVNERGEMIINWAGDYKETFRHFPYSSVIRLSEQRNLARIKEFLAAQEPSLFERPAELIAAASNAFPGMHDSSMYVACLYGAHWYETLIESEQAVEFGPKVFGRFFGLAPEDAPDLYDSQKDVYENVRLNHAALELLSKTPGMSMSEAVSKLGGPEEASRNAYLVTRQLVLGGQDIAPERPLFFLPPVVVDGKHLTFDSLRGGVFFYGLTAAGTHDLNPMPFSARYPMVGAIANVFNTIVTDQFITPLKKFWRLPLFLAIGLIAGYILSSRATVRGSVFTLLFLIGYLLFAHEVFVVRRVWIDVVGPAGIVILSDVAIVWYKFSTAEKKRKFIREAFEHYMNPKVVDQIAGNPEMLELGGKEMVLTALFSDVAGFTTISEQLTAHQLVELLNEYLTAMTDIVLKYDGLLDKYEGDAIMAVFGAPIHYPDHAARSCFVALEMQEQLKSMREKWKAEGKPELHARVGMNTGTMVVGNMGSRIRFDYTVMGDSVNLASRLEGVNKQYSTNIMISEFTLEHCKSDVIVREVDLIRVKGKAKPVRIYEVLARANDSLADTMKLVIEHYSAGLEAYRAKKWQEGIAAFQQVLEIRPGDGPSLTHLKRCNEYLKAPPPDDWDGVYVMTTK